MSQGQPVLYDLVTFNVGGTRIALTLDATWKYSAGLKPNTNVALVPYTEWDNLAANSAAFDRTGSIELWFTSSPAQGGSPDVTLQGWRITEVRASKIGTPQGQGTPRVVEYHVFFSDFREQWVMPRGGRLRLGLINAGPKPPTSAEQSADDQKSPSETGSNGPQVPEMTLSQLMSQCLDVMGYYADPTLPDGLDQIDAPRDLKWFGNHAPTELEKLLEMAGCVFCPQANGTGTVQLLTTTGDASFSGGGAALPEITLPSIDRRGTTVIFSSYPFPIVETIGLEGPKDDQWQFVLQDSKGQWQTPAKCDLVSSNGGLLAQWKKGFTDVDPKYRERVISQAYRFIGLAFGAGTSSGPGSPTYATPPAAQSPVYNSLINPDGTTGEIQVTAKIAVKDSASGYYANSTGLIPVSAAFKTSTNIVQLGRPLIQVSAPAIDLQGSAQELKLGDLQVVFSHAQSTQQKDGSWQPKFYHLGFQRQSGNITQLSDNDVENALDGGTKDTVVFAAGGAMRLRVYQENSVNQQDLVTTGKAWADKVLANAGDPARLASVQGFANCSISGLVSQVEWDQHAVKTTAMLNNWYRPLGSLSAETLRGVEASGGRGAYPAQGTNQEMRTITGEEGATMPNVPISPAGTAVATSTNRLIRVTAFDVGNAYYFGQLQNRIPSPSSPPPPAGSKSAPPVPPFNDSNDLKLSDYYQDAAGSTDCILRNDSESGIGIAAILTDGKQYITGYLDGTADDGDGNPLPLYKCNVPITDVTVKVGAVIGAGEYNSIAYNGRINDNNSANNLTMANEGLFAGPSCLLLVTEEDSAVIDGFGNAPSSFQKLMQGSFLTGTFKGMSNEGTPRPIVLVRGGVANMASPSVIDPTPTQTTADNQSWTRAAAIVGGSPVIGPVSLYVTTRGPVWNSTTNQFLFYQREISIDCRGGIFRIGPEEQIIATGTTPACPSS